MGFGLITLAHWLWPWIATPALVTPNGWIAALLIVNAAMLGWRLTMRFAFTASVYGPAEGLRAIPRAMVANVIAILACFRALNRAVRSLGGQQHPVWDKTSHHFPAVLPGE